MPQINATATLYMKKSFTTALTVISSLLGLGIGCVKTMNSFRPMACANVILGVWNGTNMNQSYSAKNTNPPNIVEIIEKGSFKQILPNCVMLR